MIFSSIYFLISVSLYFISFSPALWFLVFVLVCASIIISFYWHGHFPFLLFILNGWNFPGPTNSRMIWWRKWGSVRIVFLVSPLSLSLLLLQSWVVSLKYSAATSVSLHSPCFISFTPNTVPCTIYYQKSQQFPHEVEPPAFWGKYLLVLYCCYFPWDQLQAWLLGLPYSFSATGMILQTFCFYSVHFSPIMYKLFWAWQFLSVFRFF